MADQIWNMHQPPAPDDSEEQTIVVTSDNGEGVQVDPETGVITTELPDGSVVVDLDPPSKASEEAQDFMENLATSMSDFELGTIAEDLLEGIRSDDESRSEWLATRANGLDLLGLKLENPRGDVGSSSAPLEGMSVVRHPLLLEAVLLAQANARGELLPASGPVKVTNSAGARTGGQDGLAEALERDMNHYLTVSATEYYPDTDRMLLFTVFGGAGFKKIYPCPLRRRPVSESVDAKDLIVSNTATDLDNAPRVTHVISMRHSLLRRMIKVGAYRDIELGQPTPQPDVVERKSAEIQGISVSTERPEDQEYTIYECYCELELDEFAPEEFKGTGIALPYRVVIDYDSHKVLEIRRNWAEDDVDCKKLKTFVYYPYLRGFGFYGIGLLHLLGNSTVALTAAWREMLDTGMFANFPGFLIAKMATRQTTNQLRVAPGAGVPVDTEGKPIREAVMDLPYKDVTPGLLGLVDKITSAVQRVGGAAEIKVGEGRQDAPVGTTIALIEQATKIESSVHKNMHQAQGEEFRLLADLFRDDPESFWRGNKNPATAWDQQVFKQALNTYGITPQADPNTPSHIHRIMKAVALKQLQSANPQLYDAKEVDRRVLRVLGWDDIDSLFAPPQPAQIPTADPNKVLDVRANAAGKMDEIRSRVAIAQQRSEDAAKERESRERMAVLDLAKTLAVHPGSEGIVDETLNKQRVI